MIERSIIIACIVSTEYLDKVKSFWNPRLLVSNTARLIATWSWEYYNEYREAPRRNIESIFFKKLKDGRIASDIAEEIEKEILPGLSEEYENDGINISYIVDETLRHFVGRHLTLHNEKVAELVASGQIEEAERTVREYNPLSVSSKELNNHIASVGQIRKKERRLPQLLMKPWLRESQLTVIYGAYGSGKSLLSLLIAYVLGLKDYESESSVVGPFEVKHPTGSLYIDGEMGEEEMESRISKFEWIGQQQGRYRLRVFSIPEYQLATEDTFALSERKNQLKIIDWLRMHPDYKLVILDNVTTLFGLTDENSNSEWGTKINPLLRDLRAMNVACILLHHAGKDNKRGLRGASAIGAMANNVFRLTNHDSKNVDAGEAWFTLSKDKQRSGGFSFRTFSLHFTQTNDEHETHWNITDNF